MLPLLLLFQAATLESTWQPRPAITLNADLHHVQGIDIEGDSLWVSSVHAKAKQGYLSLFDLPSGRLIKQVELQQGARIHPGGIMLDGDTIWVPVAEYHPGGPTSVQRRDKRTLALVSQFDVADHIGCIAIAPDGTLVGGNWSSRLIYQWTRDGRHLSKRPNPIPTGWQDLKFDGDLLIGSGILTKGAEGAIDWVRLSDLSLVRRITAGKTDRGVLYTNEGIAWRNGRLYLLPEDAPSRLFEWRRKP